jgi:hypothetical protein
MKESDVSTILIGVDSTARSEDAIALARRLAQAGGGEIVVAAVVGHDPALREDARLAVRRMSGLLTGIDPERIRTGVVTSRSPAQGLQSSSARRTSATSAAYGRAAPASACSSAPRVPSPSPRTGTERAVASRSPASASPMTARERRGPH